jgi:deoxynucleoside triphosphate triphosphohydrolase SAMHD1
VDYKAVNWVHIKVVEELVTPERIVAAAKALPHAGAGDTTPVDIDALTKDDVIADFSLIHYGMKEKNPLDFVKFYSKRNPNREYFLHYLLTHRILLIADGGTMM